MSGRAHSPGARLLTGDTLCVALDARAAVELLEARGDDESFREAQLALDAELAEGEDPRLLVDRGYIHQIRGTNQLREAIRWYERALDVGPEEVGSADRVLVAEG